MSGTCMPDFEGFGVVLLNLDLVCDDSSVGRRAGDVDAVCQAGQVQGAVFALFSNDRLALQVENVDLGVLCADHVELAFFDRYGEVLALGDCADGDGAVGGALACVACGIRVRFVGTVGYDLYITFDKRKNKKDNYEED